MNQNYPASSKVANSTIGGQNIVLGNSNGSNFMAKPFFCDLAQRARLSMLE
jgi:hypothetical protein